jgi:hypothetical protein
MSITVETRPGHHGEPEPHAFTLGERRFEDLEILDRWPHPAHRYFKVRVDDGRSFVLRHDERSGSWDLAALVGTDRPLHPALC